MTVTMGTYRGRLREPDLLATQLAHPLWISHVLAAYECDSRGEVSAFLQRHPGVVPVLLEAPAHVEQWFGLGTPMTLRVYTHPEEDDAEELFVLVHFPGSAEEARKKLALFDERWWLDVAPAAGGRLGFDVLFV